MMQSSKKIVLTIFQLVAESLQSYASAWGMTYNEINILVYYLLIPFTWTMMLDCYLGVPVATGAWILIWIGIKLGTWGHFKEWCDWAFMRSVDFLNYFNRWGGDYVLNSVVVCVAVPIVIYVGLSVLLIMK